MKPTHYRYRPSVPVAQQLATLTVGDEVHYTGNMANAACSGKIVELRAFHYGVRFEGWDEVTFLPFAMLVAPNAENITHGSCLFELGAYKAARAARIAESERQLREVLRGRGGRRDTTNPYREFRADPRTEGGK